MCLCVYSVLDTVVRTGIRMVNKMVYVPALTDIDNKFSKMTDNKKENIPTNHGDKCPKGNTTGDEIMGGCSW